MRQHSVCALECFMQDNQKAYHIYGTIDFSIVLSRDKEKHQVYLCQSTTRLAQSGPNCLHFVQVFKNVFCACSFLLFPRRGGEYWPGHSLSTLLTLLPLL